MKTSRGWDCFKIYQVQKKSYASTLWFTLVQDSTQGISVILLTKQIQSSPSCTRQLALLHREMLHNSLGRKGGWGEEQKKIIIRTLRIFRESKSDCQPCNLIYKSEMHIWLIFFYYIAFISGSLFTFVPFWSVKKSKHFWHGLKLKFQMNMKHLIPFTSQYGWLSVGTPNIISPYESLVWCCNYSKIFFLFNTQKKER